jgi:fructokinase
LQYVLFIGEMLIDFIPRTFFSSEAGQAEYYQPYPGGAVANASVALARMGGLARFIGKLSEDHFGRLLLNVLRENQVETRYTPTTIAGNTTLVLVTLQSDGQREFTFYRQQTADTLLAFTDLKPEIWEGVGLFHAGSVLLASEPARAATLAAMEQARVRAIPVSFDVNVRPTIWKSEGEIRGLLEQVVPCVDLLKCSVEEAHYLDASLDSPLQPADESGLRLLGQRLLAQGPCLVIFTCGARGALLMTEHAVVTVATLQRQALDTTGAGDAFMGAVLYKLGKLGWTSRVQLAALGSADLQMLGAFANTAAGISCMRYGGISSLPYLAEVEEPA